MAECSGGQKFIGLRTNVTVVVLPNVACGLRLLQVGLNVLQRCFDAEAAGTALTGGVATPPLETLDALRAGLGVGGASRTGSVTQADFERYHEVSLLHYVYVPQ